MANDDNFRGGGSPWGAPPGGKNGSGRGGQRPPNIDEVVEKIQKLLVCCLLIFRLERIY